MWSNYKCTNQFVKFFVTNTVIFIANTYKILLKTLSVFLCLIQSNLSSMLNMMSTFTINMWSNMFYP